MAVHFGSKDGPLSSLTVHCSASDRPVWLKTLHFKDRPFLPVQTVHFRSDSFVVSLGVKFEIFQFFENFSLSSESSMVNTLNSDTENAAECFKGRERCPQNWFSHF